MANEAITAHVAQAQRKKMHILIVEGERSGFRPFDRY